MVLKTLNFDEGGYAGNNKTLKLSLCHKHASVQSQLYLCEDHNVKNYKLKHSKHVPMGENAKNLPHRGRRQRQLKPNK